MYIVKPWDEPEKEYRFDTYIDALQFGNCFMTELDPRYVDAIINRWETLTGNKAELINEGSRNEESQSSNIS